MNVVQRQNMQLIGSRNRRYMELRLRKPSLPSKDSDVQFLTQYNIFWILSLLIVRTIGEYIISYSTVYYINCRPAVLQRPAVSNPGKGTDVCARNIHKIQNLSCPISQGEGEL